MNSPIRNNKLLREAYEAGRRQALNEQGMMSNNFNTNATRFPQTGGGLVGGGNQSPSNSPVNPTNPIDPMGDRISESDFMDQWLQRLLANYTQPGDDPMTYDSEDALLGGYLNGDLNGDGVIDGADLGELLAMMGG